MQRTHNPMNKWLPLLLLLLACLCPSTLAYIDIELVAVTSSADLCLNMPITVNNQQLHLAVSMHNQQEFIVSPSLLPHKKSQSPSKHPSSATMHVSSLEGYTLQGWKRFFLQVFLFQDSKYSHTITLNLTQLKTLDKKIPMTNGIMTIGPNLKENKIYQMIKSQTGDYFKQDIVSFFTTPGNKDVYMQLGGYEEQNAQGYNNGVRFYQKPMETINDGQDWALAVGSLVVTKEKNNKWETFTIPHSNMVAKLSLESQYVVLPTAFKEDLQTSFESEEIECSFSSATSQLQCANISSVDQALTFLSFSLDSEVMVNISLYDLRDEYNPTSKLTSFFIRLGNTSQLQLGAALLRGYYLSFNLQKQTMLFSPLNRFSLQVSTAEIIRFIAIFIAFMFISCVVIVVWQQYNLPSVRKNRYTRNKDGVRLVAYQRPNEVDPDEGAAL